MDEFICRRLIVIKRGKKNVYIYVWVSKWTRIETVRAQHRMCWLLAPFLPFWLGKEDEAALRCHCPLNDHIEQRRCSHGTRRISRFSKAIFVCTTPHGGFGVRSNDRCAYICQNVTVFHNRHRNDTIDEEWWDIRFFGFEFCSLFTLKLNSQWKGANIWAWEKIEFFHSVCDRYRWLEIFNTMF